jgi:hypothetical protein
MHGAQGSKQARAVGCGNGTERFGIPRIRSAGLALELSTMCRYMAKKDMRSGPIMSFCLAT